MSAYIVDRVSITSASFTDSATTTSAMIPDWPSVGGYSYRVGWSQFASLPYTPEEAVKVFEYIVINMEHEAPVIVAGPTCIIAECADEARVAAGQAVPGVPASSLKVLVRQFA